MQAAERQYFFGPPGKRLRIHEWGDEDKPVILLVHGFPGSGEHAKLMSQTPYWNSFRLISMDRPGYGKSDVQRAITPLKFAEQIVELLAHLNIQKLSIISVSGGSPFALAIAFLMGDQIQRVSCIGGVAPITRRSFFYMNSQQHKAWWLQKFVPRSVLYFALGHAWKKGVDKLDDLLFTREGDIPDSDWKVFADPLVGPDLIATTKAALRQGPGGVIEDLFVYGNDWGFDFQKITAPVTLWHGTSDRIVNKRFSKYLKSQIPNAKLQFIPNESHYSLLLNQRDQILRELIGPFDHGIGK